MEPQQKIDLSFLDLYAEKFKEIQTKYNIFWSSLTMSYPEFFKLEMEFDNLRRSFETKRLSTIFSIDKIPERFYDDNATYYQNIENKITNLSRRIDVMEKNIEQSSRLLKQFENIKLKINIF